MQETEAYNFDKAPAERFLDELVGARDQPFYHHWSFGRFLCLD